MFLKKRILSLTLCVLIALVPALSTAESMSSYFAGRADPDRGFPTAMRPETRST